MSSSNGVNSRIGNTYALEASAYAGADLTSRELASWQPFPGSADSDLLPERDALVSRSRDITRNNGIASGALDTLKDNIVGTGLRLSANPDWRALGKSKDWAEEWSTFVESEWKSYSETFVCDAAGRQNWHSQTRQVVGASVTNGEALALSLWLPDFRSAYATKFQLIESDRLCNPNFKPDDKTHRGGIDIDPYGRPLAYYIRKTHPGDLMLNFQAQDYDWEKIPAETEWGRKRVLHVFDAERAGQSRGRPLFSSILPQFKMLDNYQRTELQAAIVNAMVAAFVETPFDSTHVAEMWGSDPASEQYQSMLAFKNEHTAPLKGAAVIPVTPGDKVLPFTPARPATAFAPFCEELQRQIGTGLNLPFELLMKNFSKTNYSSARAALLEAWRFFRSRRAWLSTYWATPCYELWLEEAINKGIIEAPGFYEFRYAYCRCKWIGPGRGWIDPVKEAEAAKIRMSTLVSTLEDECAEQGLDWEEVIEQRRREYARIEEIGLNQYIATAAPAPGVTPPAAPPQIEESEQSPSQSQSGDMLSIWSAVAS